jgi:hypothetical protein
MNREHLILLVVGLGLIGFSALLLARMKTGHELGTPGLKMAAEPSFDEGGGPLGSESVELPLNVGEFTSTPIPVAFQEVEFLPNDTTFGRRRYTAPDGFQTDISVVLMGTDRASIHKPQFCLTGQGWRIDESDLLTIPIGRPHAYDLPVMRLIATRSVRAANGQEVTVRAVFVYWFVAENRLTARHGERMWWMAKDLLATGVLPRWAYVSYLSFCFPGQEEATYERMRHFIADSVPEFQLATRRGETVSSPSDIELKGLVSNLGSQQTRE